MIRLTVGLVEIIMILIEVIEYNRAIVIIIDNGYPMGFLTGHGLLMIRLIVMVNRGGN